MNAALLSTATCRKNEGRSDEATFDANPESHAASVMTKSPPTAAKIELMSMVGPGGGGGGVMQVLLAPQVFPAGHDRALPQSTEAEAGTQPPPNEHLLPAVQKLPLPQSIESLGTHPPPVEHLLAAGHNTPFPQSSPMTLVVSFASLGSGALPAGKLIQIWSILY